MRWLRIVSLMIGLLPGVVLGQVTPDVPTLPPAVVSNINTIYERGLQQGMRPNVFAKVGDSATVSPNFLGRLAMVITRWGRVRYLRGTIDYYAQASITDENPFTRTSLAAGVGWSAATVLDPFYADPTVCRPNETPLQCEYRVSRPTVALIMIGDNELETQPVENYLRNMQRIIDVSAAMGVIPVISTLHDRGDNPQDVDMYNAALRALAEENAVPLWDYAAAIDPLPNNGLTNNGFTQVHRRITGIMERETSPRRGYSTASRCGI